MQLKSLTTSFTYHYENKWIKKVKINDSESKQRDFQMYLKLINNPTVHMNDGEFK